MKLHHFRYPLAALLTLAGLGSIPAQAAEFCADTYYIETTLPNQARWDMCWEHRNREGVVLHHIHYTPRNGTRQMVLHEAAMAQIHVPYDDNGARYHDVSDYGLGGGYIKDLAAEECPGGERLAYLGKNIICKQVTSRDDAFSVDADRLQGDALSLFSVSAIGAYNYIPEWRFLDDGAIEPGVGATGALQRFGTASIAQHGWLLESNKVGIAHLHNFFWKLDFDLGATSNDDAVEEIDHTQTAGKTSRTHTRLSTEAARNVDPAKLRFWRVLDTSLRNSKNLPTSYDIQLNESGQKDEGPSSEPFTHYDFYVTRQKNCELFASHNPTTNGCAADLSTFVNGESLVGQDLVVWPSVTFYHMPRAEDAPRMDTHWTHFRITPRDWHNRNPLSDSNETGATTPPPPPPPAGGTVSNNGSGISVNGSLTDWSSLSSFGADPDDVSGTSNKLNWLEGWMANDTSRVYLAYKTKGTIDTSGFWGYQAYLDTDASSTTGYRTGALGADYLLEGSNLWRYSGDGTSWNWTHQGSLTHQVSGNVAEFSFPRSWLGNSTELRLFFWGNNIAFGGDAKDIYPDGAFSNSATTRYFTYKMYTASGSSTSGISNPVSSLTTDGNLADWSSLTSFGTDPADVSGTSNPLDWLEGWMAHNSSNLWLAYRTRNNVNTSGFWGYQVYLDTDSNPASGYQRGTVGAEYLLEGSTLWRYSGDGTSWSWTQQGTSTYAINGQTAEFSLPRSWLGNPARLRVVFHGNNRALGGDAEDAYPNVTANPAYFEYRF
ncbi:MAG TPA: hypothetical protein PLE99_00585 [Candidatus Thiothrix moscowensis]|uniref:copper amine oxidase n=1 Tax=unclassified Thiothrix TaxID=2636184 RepID=UPI0025D95219|nr:MULTISPECIES: hypothetical protein [unclassified Thiothrix]HRJ51231.1 hypothetical protein [Candidatus Thiothrix moscowensis]HRJ91714.1 hypothetical protein [Candidatus Thiothrix moscowensis]